MPATAQFYSATICDRVAVLLANAMGIDVNPIEDVVERTPPRLSVVCNEVPRVGEFVKQNTWEVVFTVAGRFPFPESGTVQADKDAKANAIYQAVVTNSTGRIFAADGTTVLLTQLRCEGPVWTQPENADPARYYDISMTFRGYYRYPVY